MNTHQITFDEGLHSFSQALAAANKSAATIAAYQTDIRQFLAWLSDNSLATTLPAQVVRADITQWQRRLYGDDV